MKKHGSPKGENAGPFPQQERDDQQVKEKAEPGNAVMYPGLLKEIPISQ